MSNDHPITEGTWRLRQDGTWLYVLAADDYHVCEQNLAGFKRRDQERFALMFNRIVKDHNTAPALHVEVAKLKQALEEIANQRTSDEHGAYMRSEGHADEDDSDEACGDYVTAHDLIISAARRALGRAE